jgi:glycine/D-amino acid oxidase-like deaminating enzyme
MVAQADVVVIGAGAFGCSAAYHLARRGLSVALLDRYAPASQTSPRAAGLFKQIQSSEAHTQIARLSIEQALAFERETGVPLPVEASGSLMVARTRAHAALIEREVAASRAWGVEIEMLGPAEAHRLCPWLETEELLACAYTPGDVYIEEPAALLSAYLYACAPLGVTVLPFTPVQAVRVENGQVSGVLTEHGLIATPVVVDAAGAWARLVGASARAQVPVVPMRHQLYITDAITGMSAKDPIVRLIDAAVYVRPCRGGLMMGGFEQNPLPMDAAPARPDFSMDKVPLDMAVLEGFAAEVADCVPELRAPSIAEHRAGLFTMTRDGRFLVGPVPGLRGFWAATGCNGSGFSSSPGIGQVLAEWIVTGQPPINMDLFAPARFADLSLDDADLRAAAVYQYSHYYDPEGL